MRRARVSERLGKRSEARLSWRALHLAVAAGSRRRVFYDLGDARSSSRSQHAFLPLPVKDVDNDMPHDRLASIAFELMKHGGTVPTTLLPREQARQLLFDLTIAYQYAVHASALNP
jgi:hypothetical protein